VKLFSYIFALILFASSLYPCGASFACKSAVTVQEEACHDTSEDEHACCQSSAEKDPAPTEEDHCADDCFCQCCMVVLTIAPEVTQLLAKLEVEQQKCWQVSAYSHDFTPMIWQPPQIA